MPSASRARWWRPAPPRSTRAASSRRTSSRAAASLGLHGVTVSTAWGGAGRDYLSYALAIEAIGRASATVATSLVVTNSLVAELVEHAGTDAQRDRWLRRLTGGGMIGAFALSEPAAGTDAANQQATATPAGDGYRVVGRKVWVANAAAAGVIIVFAATQPGRRGQGVTAFLVPADAPGITRTARRRFARRARPRLHGSRSRRDRGGGPGARPRERGLRPGDVGAAGRPRGDRRAGARHRAGRAGRSDRAREETRAVRTADRPVRSDPVDDRRRRDRARRGPHADVEGRDA